jgi:putative MATE family efflux protein
MSISSVFGMGGSSVIARLLGEKQHENAKRTITYSTYLMALSGIIVLVIGLVLLKPIASLAGADAENMSFTSDYLFWIFLGAPFIILSNGLVHIFRSAGLIKQATTGIILGNGINIVLDWVFIVLLDMGTAGAALATSIGFFCATIYFFFCMFIEILRKNELFSLSPKYFKVSPQTKIDVIKIGIPGSLITIMLSVSNIVLNNCIGGYGSNAVAAYGIAFKIDTFPIMLGVGLSQGVGPLLGYCYGANQKDRLKKAMTFSSFDGIILGAIFTVAFLLFSRPLVSIFLQDNELIELSARFLRAAFLGIVNMVTAYFQALGKAKSSLIITMLRNVILFIPGVLILNALFGINGAIAAQPVVEILLTGICLLMMNYSQKKEEKLMLKSQAA